MLSGSWVPPWCGESWCGDCGFSVDHDDLQDASVDQPVVVPAQEYAVVDVGGSAVSVGDDVVCLGCGGWDVTVLVQTGVSVAGGDRSSLCRGEEPSWCA
jgi:hypothetical protein